MATKPTKRDGNRKLQDQKPAPDISRNDLLDQAQRDAVLQRHSWVSNNYNSVRTVARIYADWVMEDEVPATTGTFLEYPTRRAFMDDEVQLRIQISKVGIDPNSKICIYLHDKDAAGADYALVIGSDQAQMTTLANRGVNAVHRPLQAGSVKNYSTVNGRTHIGVEITTNPRTFISTTIKLPTTVDPEQVLATYHATVEIIDTATGTTHFAYSPTIEAWRWWAKPTSNMNVVRTHPTTVTPLVDGELFFQHVAALLRAAVAGDKVYLASWSFTPFIMVAGGANAVAGAQAAGNRAAAMANTLACAIDDAQNNGATVYVLLDSHNAPFGWEPISHLLHNSIGYFQGVAPRIQVRDSGHPEMLNIGVGRLKKSERIGSYHEKYACLTGSQHIAIIGGIDAQADRFNPVGHGWRHWGQHYRQFLRTHVYTSPGVGTAATMDNLVNAMFDAGPNMLWHDVGVKIEGERAVHDLLKDFVRRWNEGTDMSANCVDIVPAVAVPADPGGEKTVQFVKTEDFRTAHGGIAVGKYHGTFDAHIQAINTARHYVYMENQYMRDKDVAEALVKALQSNSRLQVILVIPFITEEAIAAGNHRRKSRSILWMLKETGKKIGKIQDRANLHGDFLQHRFLTSVKAAGQNRVGIYGLAKYMDDLNNPRVEQIYPHAKTMVVDDTWAYIGSANANGRSMKLDGESGYVIHDRAVVTAYRQQLWTEHLCVAAPGTREIRTFAAHWDGGCVKNKQLGELTQPDVAATFAAEIANPPRGQKYNGPGSWFIDLHDKV